MQSNEDALIFLSYASPDRDRVIPYFDALTKAGFNLWIDYRRLKAGQNWDFEIKRALEKSAIVLVFISNNSVTKRGYVQREIKLALDKLEEKLIDDIYIIPILLDNSISLPPQLSGIQGISAEDPDSIGKITESLKHQLDRLGESKAGRIGGDLSWSHHKVFESWEGLPGYEVEIQFIRLQSEKYATIRESAELIRGEFLRTLLSARGVKLRQDPERFNFGQESFRRTNTLDAHCGDPAIKGKVFSILYSIHSYSAGAAHPNIDFASFAFVLDPVSLIESLAEIFSEERRSFDFVQATLRSQLAKDLHGTSGGDVEIARLDQLNRGTMLWSDFRHFIFKSDGIEFIFPPYQIAGYASGPRFAEISYLDIVEMIKPEFQSLLGIEHIAYKKRMQSSKGNDNSLKP